MEEIDIATKPIRCSKAPQFFRKNAKGMTQFSRPKERMRPWTPEAVKETEEKSCSRQRAADLHCLRKKRGSGV